MGCHGHRVADYGVSRLDVACAAIMVVAYAGVLTASGIVRFVSLSAILATAALRALYLTGVRAGRIRVGPSMTAADRHFLDEHGVAASSRDALEPLPNQPREPR